MGNTVLYLYIIYVHINTNISLGLPIGKNFLNSGDRINTKRSETGDRITQEKYGFPFAGDNNFLFDRIDCLDKPLPTHWFVKSDSKLTLEPGAVGLTVEIDRQNPSQTKSLLFSTTQHPSTSLSDSEWLSIFESS